MSLDKLITDLSFNHYSAFVPIILSCILFIFYTTQLVRGLSTKKLYWFFLIMFIFLIRSKDFYLEFMNPDEEQWLICANSIIASPSNWLNHFALFDFTRLFTILPLVLTGIVSKFLSYDHARFINLILFITYVYFQFKLLCLTFNEKTAIVITSFITLIFATSKNPDLIAYNSEISVLVLLTISLFIHTKEIKVGEGRYNAFLSGVFIAFIPFAKEQAILITGLTVLYIAIHWIKNKNIPKLTQFLLGGILGFTIIIAPLIYIYGIREILWNFVNGIEYSKYGLTMKAKVNESNGLRFLFSVWFNKELFIVSSIAVFSFCFMLFTFAKRKISIDASQVFFTTLLLTTLYTIYLPGNFFFHYNIFLFLPFSWMIGWLYFNYLNESKRWFIIPAFLMLLIFSKFYDRNWRLFYPISEILSFNNNDNNDPVYKLIKVNTRAGDRMMIWGWGNNYYLASKLQRSSGFLYPQFAMGVYSGKQHTISIYRHNLAVFQPKVIVELAGENRFFFTDKTEHSIQKNAPELYKDILLQYDKIKEDKNYIFYKRK
jgi:hypothetical protein